MALTGLGACFAEDKATDPWLVQGVQDAPTRKQKTTVRTGQHDRFLFRSMLGTHTVNVRIMTVDEWQEASKESELGWLTRIIGDNAVIAVRLSL